MREKQNLPKIGREVGPGEKWLDVEHLERVHRREIGRVSAGAEAGEGRKVEVRPGAQVRVRDAGGGGKWIEHGAYLQHSVGMVQAGELRFGVGCRDGFL